MQTQRNHDDYKLIDHDETAHNPLISRCLHGYMAIRLYVCTFSLSCTDFPIRMCSAVYPGFETLFCEFTTCPFRVSSLCLSRACLGKMIRFRPKVSQKTVFLPGYLGVHDVGARAVPVGVRVDRRLLTRKRISISQPFFPTFVPSLSW